MFEFNILNLSKYSLELPWLLFLSSGGAWLDSTTQLNPFRVHSDSIVTQNDWTYQKKHILIFNLSCGPKLPPTKFGSQLENTLFLRVPLIQDFSADAWRPTTQANLARFHLFGQGNAANDLCSIAVPLLLRKATACGEKLEKFCVASNNQMVQEMVMEPKRIWKEDTSFKTSFIISLMFHLFFQISGVFGWSST